MTEPGPSLAPSFYASTAPNRSAWADWWVLLHPPYTLWHLSYVAIGASLAQRFDAGRLAATLVAFFLGVGVCAHALDELHGRPLRTRLPTWLLIGAAVVSLTGAVVLGFVGITYVGPGLIAFIAIGVLLTCGYNLELFAGRLHNDVTFAAAWGAFPVLTAYYAQAETLRVPALAAATGAYGLSIAQRSLSTPARTLRRRVRTLHATITYDDGRRQTLQMTSLLEPLEAALKATAWAIVSLAIALVVFRATTS